MARGLGAASAGWALTQAEMCQALGVVSEWKVIWEDTHALPNVEHIRGGQQGPGGAYQSGYQRLADTPTQTPGIEAARGERRRIVWGREVDL